MFAAVGVQALRLKPMYPKMLLRKARLQKRLCYWEEAIKVVDMYTRANACATVVTADWLVGLE